MSISPATRRGIAVVFVLFVTALCSAAIGTRLRLDPNVASLLPERGDAAGLRRYTRAFGGSDLTLVLVNAEEGASDRADEVRRAADRLAEELESLPSVRAATAALEARQEQLDPLLVWRHADASAREELARALTPEGMRARLRETRALLLAPGAGAAAEAIQRDPLRLRELAFRERRVESGFQPQADGSFSTQDGLARLVLVFPEGQALRGEDAKRFVTEAREAIARVAAEHPDLQFGLTGGHAIAEATERMLTDDLSVSGTISLVLAALAFALTFRRYRALLAVMPPLALGTIWTAGFAAMLPGGLSAIAIAFMSVVVGVGVDTGVHVYAALLEARRDGLEPAAAARRARRRTTRPVLVAAGTAAAAFGALGLSEIGAVRQLGVLCAVGEVLTAIAIVLVTPEIGARLERGAPPAKKRQRWLEGVGWLTGRRRRAAVMLALTLAPLAAVVAGFTPVASEAIVALRPSGLEPLEVQDRIYRLFGGRRGQWVVLVADHDQQAALARADTVAERLGGMPESVEAIDALTALVPAESTQRARLAERDALDLPARADELAVALAETGFSAARFEGALASMRSPPHEVVTLAQVARSESAVMLSRYLGRDGDEELVALYVLPRPGQEALVEAAIRDADPRASITGYDRLESSLRATLAADLPMIGAVAALLVVIALALSLRRPLDVVLALGVVSAEIGVVLFLVRVLDVPMHAYDALVLPVLLGITVDEAMFLLHRARSAKGGDVIDETLQGEGPQVATTALTTAAGFAALGFCDFDGLRHLGMVGALGSVAGLVVAFVIVPSGLRLAGRRARPGVGVAASG